MNDNTMTDDERSHRTVLTVRVASVDEVFDELEARFAALDVGERPKLEAGDGIRSPLQ